MTERLYHQTAQGRGMPAWWFGAPVVAFAYAWLAPRFVPDIVAIPDELPSVVATGIRWMVGLLVGVMLLTGWRLLEWRRSRRRE